MNSPMPLLLGCLQYLQDDYMTQEAQDAAIKKAYAQAAAAVTGAPPAIKAAASTGLSIVEATSQASTLARVIGACGCAAVVLTVYTVLYAQRYACIEQ